MSADRAAAPSGVVAFLFTDVEVRPAGGPWVDNGLRNLLNSRRELTLSTKEIDPGGINPFKPQQKNREAIASK